MDNVTIRPLRLNEPWPMELLLRADPSHELINSYMSRGGCFIAERNDETIAEYVLIDTRPLTGEIVSIAVKESEEGQGLGRDILLHAIHMARQRGYRTVELGTGNSSIGPLALYQKCGFRIVGVDRDFFTLHYSKPIYEHGILCRDMIRLALVL